MEAGERIDGWVVERRLGSGGMGSVYRCHNASTDRIVAALKVLDRSLRSSPEASTRFVREAEILAGLDHPNIVRVRNVRIDADPPYLEMEFVEGEGLDAVIARGPLAYARARSYARQIADAVTYLHAKGVRHRDLKPANVLVDAEDRVRIVDFGLATETSLERITEQGLNFGTVSYAPPEWMDPDHLDPVQWDLYAIGVVFYELLTGRIAYPLCGEGPVKKQLLQVMMHKQVAPPLDPGEAFPDEVRALIRELTARDPGSRPQSARELLARIRALPETSEATVPLQDRRDDGAPAPARSPASMVDTIPPRRSWGGWVVGGLGLLVAGLAVTTVTVAGLTWLGGEDPPEETPVGVVAPPPPGPGVRAVSLQVVGLPESVPVRVVVGGRSADAVSGVATITGVTTDRTLATWVAGAGCDACPGEACPLFCGGGEVPIEAGSGEASVVVPVRPGEGTVVVEVPSLAKDAGKSKRRKKWGLSVRLDGVEGATDGASSRFTGVAPGRHALVVEVGECPGAAAGCWPGGTCPDRCRSESREVVIPFAGGDVRTRSDVPTP
jgi:hypothetical protein